MKLRGEWSVQAWRRRLPDMLEPMLGKGPFTMLHQLTIQDWRDHLQLWQTDPWRAWDSHQGGYVLALGLAFLLPVARMLLRILISHVSPWAIDNLMQIGYLRHYDGGQESLHVNQDDVKCRYWHHIKILGVYSSMTDSFPQCFLHPTSLLRCGWRADRLQALTVLLLWDMVNCCANLYIEHVLSFWPPAMCSNLPTFKPHENYLLPRNPMQKMLNMPWQVPCGSFIKRTSCHCSQSVGECCPLSTRRQIGRKSAQVFSRSLMVGLSSLFEICFWYFYNQQTSVVHLSPRPSQLALHSRKTICILVLFQSWLCSRRKASSSGVPESTSIISECK